MDRKELINKGAAAVRNTPHLFNAYKQFLLEDWGKLPEGCFGCKFNSYFNKWKNQVLSNNIIKMEEQINANKTYVLKDKSTNKYLYGEVYSNYSPDGHWIKYLKLIPEGKELFMVLPEGISRTDEDQATEEEFKKKELNEEPETGDAVVNETIVFDEKTSDELNEEPKNEDQVSDSINEVDAESNGIIEIASEELSNQKEVITEEPTNEDPVEENPKRGRKKQA